MFIFQSPDEQSFKSLCIELCAGQGSEVEGESPDEPFLKFVYHSMNGNEVELCPGGRNIIVRYDSKIM